MTAVPEYLKNERRWVLWAHRDGRKPPVDADGTPSKTWNEPSAWLDFESATRLAESSTRIDGIGFVLGDGFGGIDLDKCRADGKIDPRAEAVVQIADAYTEVSPSGK